MVSSFPTQSLFSLQIFSETKTELYSLLSNHLKKENQLLTIATPNPEQIVQTWDNSEFFKNLHFFDLLLPDGQGIVWASRWLGKPVEERIAGVEVVDWLLTNTQEKILVIGGRDYGKKSSKFKVQNSNLAVGLLIHRRKVFWIEGYQDIKNPTKDEEEQVKKTIQELKPEVVLIAFGAPWQEKWVIDHKEMLKKHHVKLAMIIGGAMDMLSGKVKQAPVFIQDLHLEWLFRLIQEPWRWRRQVRLIQFAIIVLQKVVTQKK